MSPAIVEVHLDCAGSRNLGGWSECFPRLRPRCGAVRMFVHAVTFRGKRKGNLVFWWFNVEFRDRSGFTSKSADFVAGAVLWTWS